MSRVPSLPAQLKTTVDVEVGAVAVFYIVAVYVQEAGEATGRDLVVVNLRVHVISVADCVTTNAEPMLVGRA